MKEPPETLLNGEGSEGAEEVASTETSARGARQSDAAPGAMRDTHSDGTAVYGRAWVDSDGRGDSGLPNVRVLQWNVLADSLSKGSDEEHLSYESQGAGGLPGQRWVGWGKAGPPQDYQRPHLFRCAQRWLLWGYRGPRIVEEIRRYSPDIISLQEVDQYNFLRKHLPEYQGIFAKKTGYEDGVALLWRSPWVRGAGRVFRFSRGAQVAVAQRLLIPAEAGSDGRAKARALVAVSMHLKAGFSERYEMTRETQLDLLTDALRQFAQSDPVVILADLNAHPTDLQGMSAQAVPLVLDKGYASAYPPSGFTVWSGWTDGEVRATFDHILFTATALRCRRYYALPPVSAVHSEPCRLPNHRWPSDHLPLAADLLLRRAPRETHPDTDEPAESTVTLVTPQALSGSLQSPLTSVSRSGLAICRYFAQGLCAYSQMCKLPHSDGRRGERCFFFNSGQQCRHGDTCHFLHSVSSAHGSQFVLY